MQGYAFLSREIWGFRSFLGFSGLMCFFLGKSSVSDSFSEIVTQRLTFSENLTFPYLCCTKVSDGYLFGGFRCVLIYLGFSDPVCCFLGFSVLSRFIPKIATFPILYSLTPSTIPCRAFLEGYFLGMVQSFTTFSANP